MALKSPSGRAGSPHTAQAFRQHRTPSPARLTEPQASDKRGGSTVKAGSLAPRAGCGKAVPPGQELRVTAQNLLAWQGAEPGTRGQERGGGRVRARVGRDGPEPRWNPEARGSRRPGDRRPWPGPLLTRDLRGLGSVLLRCRPRRPSLTPSIHSGRLTTRPAQRAPGTGDGEAYDAGGGTKARLRPSRGLRSP